MLNHTENGKRKISDCLIRFRSNTENLRVDEIET